MYDVLISGYSKSLTGENVVRFANGITKAKSKMSFHPKNPVKEEVMSVDDENHFRTPNFAGFVIMTFIFMRWKSETIFK